MVLSEGARNRLMASFERLLPRIDAMFMRYNAIADQPIYAPNDFPWVAKLEANWHVIRDEALRVLGDRIAAPSVRELSPEHRRIALDDKWRSFFLQGYGVKVAQNCALCPETTKLISEVPGLITAFYSIMLAGARIPRHTGPTKAIITAHLGLKIPQQREQCRMDVNGETVLWENGRTIIFDDMYPHQVWNDTDEHRVVLLMHIKRPLRFPGSMIRDSLFAAARMSPFVRDGVRNIERWKERNAATT